MRPFRLFAVILAWLFLTAAGNEPPAPEVPSKGPYLHVDVSDQKMRLYVNGRAVKTYPVSTSRYGTGTAAGSNKTPLGRHRIAQKIGSGAPPGTIFVNRTNTGRTAPIQTDPVPAGKDYITSRILWLEGLEEGVNKGPGRDSFARFIYIHGTAEEGFIGAPASHGCIRMTNRDVVDLFERVGVGTRVDIHS